MDFTVRKYRELLKALEGRDVLLRHDVDKRPDRSLVLARLEAELGWKAVYYFRAVPESWDEDVIREISALGHGIGYHYESLATCHGNVDAAWEDFKCNLEKLRRLAPVSSVCMHGSPCSKWDNRDIWKKYDYRSVGIDFEPYLDCDFGKCFYLTDTGRCWDGARFSVRDRIPRFQDEWTSAGLMYHSTDDIIRAASDGTLPQRIMINAHPQRWTDSVTSWMVELFFQKIKNVLKYILNRATQTSRHTQSLAPRGR